MKKQKREVKRPLEKPKKEIKKIEPLPNIPITLPIEPKYRFV